MPMFILDPEGVDRVRMAAQERNTRIYRFMDELSADDAFTFTQICALIADAPDASNIANYFQGQMHTILRVIHKICVNCGDKHDPLDHDEWASALEESQKKHENEVDNNGEADSGTA